MSTPIRPRSSYTKKLSTDFAPYFDGTFGTDLPSQHQHSHYSTDNLTSNLKPSKTLPWKSSNSVMCKCCGHIVRLNFSPEELVASQALTLEENAKLRSKLLSFKETIDGLQSQGTQLSMVLERAQLQVSFLYVVHLFDKLTCFGRARRNKKSRRCVKNSRLVRMRCSEPERSMPPSESPCSVPLMTAERSFRSLAKTLSERSPLWKHSRPAPRSGNPRMPP